MVQETVPAAKRRPNAHMRELRRARIFARLREGWPYAEIAREEGLTDRRIRQIVSETLKKRVVDTGTDHAMLQLARLEPALRLAAEAVGSGDIKAIRYYLKLLDQLDPTGRPPPRPKPMTTRRARDSTPRWAGSPRDRRRQRSRRGRRDRPTAGRRRPKREGQSKNPSPSAATL